MENKFPLFDRAWVLITMFLCQALRRASFLDPWGFIKLQFFLSAHMFQKLKTKIYSFYRFSKCTFSSRHSQAIQHKFDIHNPNLCKKKVFSILFARSCGFPFPLCKCRLRINLQSSKTFPVFKHTLHNPISHSERTYLPNLDWNLTLFNSADFPALSFMKKVLTNN